MKAFEVVHGVKLIAENDRVIEDAKKHGGRFEPESIITWQRFLDKCTDEDMVLDIGAYTGIYSLLAAKRGVEWSAHEPMRDQFCRMGENFVLNGYSLEYFTDRVSNVAISPIGGVCQMGFSDALLTSGASLNSNGPNIKTVNSIPLWKALKGHKNRVRFIKMDVESAEEYIFGACSPEQLREIEGIIVEGDNRRLQPILKHLGFSFMGKLDNRNLLFLRFQ